MFTIQDASRVVREYTFQMSKHPDVAAGFTWHMDIHASWLVMTALFLFTISSLLPGSFGRHSATVHGKQLECGDVLLGNPTFRVLCGLFDEIDWIELDLGFVGVRLQYSSANASHPPNGQRLIRLAIRHYSKFSASFRVPKTP